MKALSANPDALVLFSQRFVHLYDDAEVDRRAATYRDLAAIYEQEQQRRKRSRKRGLSL